MIWATVFSVVVFLLAVGVLYSAGIVLYPEVKVILLSLSTVIMIFYAKSLHVKKEELQETTN